MRSQGSLIGANNSAATGNGIWNLNAFFDQPPRNNAGKWGADRPAPEYLLTQGIWTLDEITRLGRANQWNSTVLNQFSLEVAVVAGGGNGGSGRGSGGGGAGGMIVQSVTGTAGSTYTATVGGSGQNSSLSGFSLDTALAGGAEQSNGGSGGGGYGGVGLGTSGQGNNGGDGYGQPGGGVARGGGGGKSSAGSNGNSGGGGTGGAGLEWPSGSSDYYAGGGGGAIGGDAFPSNTFGSPGGGGTGGGGAGDGTNGTANTGGGGGGNGGIGGSGIVILKIRNEQYSATTTGSPTVEDFNDGSTDFKLVKFTGNGSYTA